jgi:uncharacterized oligopeptide transporter (OPT) family protein
MHDVIKKALKVIAVIWFLGLAVLGFLAYFVTSSGPSDGLGRALTETPVVVRIFFGQERMWAGWRWFAVDMVVFWGSIGAALAISKLLGRDADA